MGASLQLNWDFKRIVDLKDLRIDIALLPIGGDADVIAGWLPHDPAGPRSWVGERHVHLRLNGLRAGPAFRA